MFQRNLQNFPAMGMRSLNVFISEVNLWIRGEGPEQNVAQLQQTLQAVLAGLQL